MPEEPPSPEPPAPAPDQKADPDAAIVRYVDALARHPKADHKAAAAKLARIEAALARPPGTRGAPSGLVRIELAMEAEQLTAAAAAPDFDELEAAFIAHGKAYSARRNVTWRAWRRLGVPVSILRKAGVSR